MLFLTLVLICREFLWLMRSLNNKANNGLQEDKRSTSAECNSVDSVKELVRDSKCLDVPHIGIYSQFTYFTLITHRSYWQLLHRHSF